MGAVDLSRRGHTARYQPEELSPAVAHVRRLVGRGQTVMIQPYMASVDGEGEAKLVFIEATSVTRWGSAPCSPPGRA